MKQYSEEYIKGKFIEMAHEFVNLVMEVANEDIGEIVMTNEDINASIMIGKGSKVERPSRYYSHIIDMFNGTIWPKYPYIKNITFSYFWNVRMMNFTVALHTEVLLDLKKKAKELSEEYDKKLKQELGDNCEVHKKYSQMMDILYSFRINLEKEMDKLILKHIKKYDERINDIEMFKLIYEDSYDFLHYKALDKVIENY